MIDEQTMRDLILQSRALQAARLRLYPNGTLEVAQPEPEPERDTHDEWRKLNDG